MPRWVGWLPDMPRRVLRRNLRRASRGLVAGTLRFAPGAGTGMGMGTGTGYQRAAVAAYFLTRILGSSLWELLN